MMTGTVTVASADQAGTPPVKLTAVRLDDQERSRESSASIGSRSEGRARRAAPLLAAGGSVSKRRRLPLSRQSGYRGRAERDARVGRKRGVSRRRPLAAADSALFRRGEARRAEPAVVCQRPPVVPSAQFGDRRRSRTRSTRLPKPWHDARRTLGGGARRPSRHRDNASRSRREGVRRSCAPPASVGTEGVITREDQAPDDRERR